MAEGDEEVEEWIALTQAMLGQFIVKPRMLTERLRKPPFRFLFDIAAEVARQTGFGLQELFGGELREKPPVPGSREEKVSFLECWITLTAAMLGQQAPEVTLISAQSIVCGIQPEWTNYLLQCTAAAGWPENCAPPAPPVVAQSAAAPEGAAVDGAEPPAAAPEVALVAPEVAPVAEASAPSVEVPAAAAPTAQEADAAATAEAVGALEAQVVGVAATEPFVAEPVAVPPPPLEEQLKPTIDVEQARNLAEGMDFTTCLQEYDQMHQEFAVTTSYFHRSGASPEPKGDGDAVPAPPVASPEGAPLPPDSEPPRPVTGGEHLMQAKHVTAKVDQEIQKAADLLASIEEGLDQADETIQQKREAEIRRQREVAEALARQEAEARAQEEEERRLIEEHEAQRKAEKEAARAQRKAEKEAREHAAKFPMSKTSMMQSARVICSLGDEESDYGEDEEQTGSARQDVQEKPAPSAAETDFPLSACLTDDLLEPSKAPAPTLGQMGPTALFEQLKGELKDTFVSYLCASMPESLLKKYQPEGIIGCLQILLTELRKCIKEHGLEDVHDEEPTSLAEELRRHFPNDWLPHLQSASPWALRQKYDLPELIDTLQGLAQTCFERLNDELGPITMWASESNPLRKLPDEPPAPVPQAEAEQRSSQGALRATSTSPTEARAAPAPAPAAAKPAPAAEPQWSAALGPAPWEDAASAPPATAGPPRTAGPTRTGSAARINPPPTAGGRMTAEAHLRAASQGRGGSVSPQPAFSSALGPAPWESGGGTTPPPPVFSSALGPAPWEQDYVSGPTPATASRLPTGAGRTAGGQRPLTQQPQRPLTQQPQRPGTQYRGFAVTSR